jgi:small subunit ribosomal protein S8
MVSTDPIADMLTRIRNAIAVQKHHVVMPHSKLKQAVAELLATSGFVEGVDVTEASAQKTLSVVINSESQASRITEIHRVSTPGRRVYVRSADIPIVKRGRGIVIISTSKGLMTGQKAKSAGLGGEIICEVY